MTVKPGLSIADSRRRCGACNACCTHLSVPTLGKSAGQECPHLKPGVCGCTIHDSRPNECRNFSCVWLDGGFSPDDRPDKIGVIFFAQHNTAFAPNQPIVAAKSVLPDGLITGRGKVVFDLVRQKRLLLLITADRRELFGPPELLAQAERNLRAWIAQHGEQGVQVEVVRQPK